MPRTTSRRETEITAGALVWLLLLLLLLGRPGAPARRTGPSGSCSGRRGTARVETLLGADAVQSHDVGGLGPEVWAPAPGPALHPEPFSWT
eukprot:7468468-Pyramimonas_sp.AAC.1